MADSRFLRLHIVYYGKQIFAATSALLADTENIVN
jgi:hypothetical protein